MGQRVISQQDSGAQLLLAQFVNLELLAADQIPLMRGWRWWWALGVAMSLFVIRMKKEINIKIWITSLAAFVFYILGFAAYYTFVIPLDF